MAIPRIKTAYPVVMFLAIAAFFQGTGALMGVISGSGIDGWYQGLVKSPLNPPDYIFGIAWTALYFLLSVSFFLIWRSPETKQRRTALLLFILHMLLNWAWSPLFFMAHQLFAAFALILVMIATAVFIAAYYYRNIDRLAALLWVPYIGWLCFAAHLSHYIWAHN